MLREELRAWAKESLAKRKAEIELREAHQAHLEADKIITKCKQALIVSAKAGLYCLQLSLSEFKITHLDLVRTALESKLGFIVRIDGSDIIFDWSE